jgi:tetratricopeptide (TPR) repeat protein
MAKKLLVCVLGVLVSVLVSCRGIDTGASQLVPEEAKTTPVVKPVEAGEADLVEQMAVNRQAYRNALKTLISHYEQIGNNMKLIWAKDELKKLDDIPQYNYIIDAVVAPEDLRPTASISEADYMYKVAVRLEKDAGRLLLVKNEEKLRSALDLYNKIIRKFPSSDKIDDCAYRAAGIHEYFKDYTIAVVYYKRAFQWNPKIQYSARYKAAYILDNYLQRKDEALELYRQSLGKENLDSSRREYIQMRISEITKGTTPVK